MWKKEFPEKWLQGRFFSLGKNKKILLVGGIFGLVLLLLPEILPQNSQKEQQTVFSTQAYIQNIEHRLVSIIGSIQGAGKCKVMVTLENGVEYVYATEEKNNSDRQEENGTDENRVTQRNDSESSAIVIDSGAKREGLLVTELQPTVRGVVVVCEGGDHEEIREQIAQAVTVALNISSKRVFVTKLS